MEYFCGPLLAFLGISVLVICTPGPDTAMTIRNALLGGRSAGLATAAGVSTGLAIWALATSVVADEWPELLARGSGSDKTQRAFMLFSRSILAIEPSLGRQTNIHAEILRSFDAIAEARLNAVTVSLSATFWQAILFAVLILLFVSSTVERTRFRSIIMGCQMAVLGAFIGFVFIMDQPFKGHSAVDPQVIVQTIAILEARKGG